MAICLIIGLPVSELMTAYTRQPEMAGSLLRRRRLGWGGYEDS